MCERIELTTTVIKLWKIVKWANLQEGYCVVFTIVWNSIIYNNTGITII